MCAAHSYARIPNKLRLGVSWSLGADVSQRTVSRYKNENILRLYSRNKKKRQTEIGRIEGSSGTGTTTRTPKLIAPDITETQNPGYEPQVG